MMMRSWWMVRRMAGLGCAIGALGIPPGLLAQQVPSVTSTSHLTEVMGQTWTNDPAAKLFPPGTEFELNIGGIAFENTFETSLVNSLIPVTNDTVVLYPVSVIETNLPSRQRIYYNADEVAVLTSAVNDVNYPNEWIEEAFGPPPGYLAGAELDAWYAERDPARCTLVFDLLSTSHVPAYVAMLTNGVSELTSTQTWEDLLILYSNDIAAVGILEAAETVGVYVHAPTNVSLLDVFSSADLLDTNAWVHRGVYAHTINPTLFIDDAGGTQLVYTAADALADEDGDLLSSGREVFLYHTSSTTNDTDGDGLTDGQEILTYGLNALRADSDGDGLGDFTYSALSNVRGYYDPQFDELGITELAVHPKQAFSVTNKFDSSIVVEIGVDAEGGIESVASTVVHERMHQALYGSIMSPDDDTDSDGVPDNLEGVPPYYLKVGDTDTFNIASRFPPSSNYHKYGDSEFLCRLDEKNLVTSPESDWAKPGMQWTGSETQY